MALGGVPIAVGEQGPSAPRPSFGKKRPCVLTVGRYVVAATPRSTRVITRTLSMAPVSLSPWNRPG